MRDVRCLGLGVVLAASLSLVGCGSRGSGGSLDITENGTYDVSGYDQVVVHVGEGGQSPEVVVEDPVPEVQDLGLTRVQFSDLSMEIPAVMVEGYTEEELTENNIYILRMDTGGDRSSGLTVEWSPVFGLYTDISECSDNPIEDVNGINMAVKHEHSGDSREVKVQFIYNDNRYSIYLDYPVEQDALFADYADGFYRSIEMN